MSPNKRKIAEAESSFENESSKHRRSSLKVNLSYLSTPSTATEDDSSDHSINSNSPKGNNKIIVGKAPSENTKSINVAPKKKVVRAKVTNNEEEALGKNCEWLKRAILSKTRQIFDKSNEISTKTYSVLEKERPPEHYENLSSRNCQGISKTPILPREQDEIESASNYSPVQIGISPTNNDSNSSKHSSENFEQFEGARDQELSEDSIVGTPRIRSRSLGRDAARPASPRKRLFDNKAELIANNLSDSKENGCIKSPILSGNFRRHNLSRFSLKSSTKINENSDTGSPILSGRKGKSNVSRLSLKSTSKLTTRSSNTVDNNMSPKSKGQVSHWLDGSRLSFNSAREGSISPGLPLTCSSYIDERKNKPSINRKINNSKCKNPGQSYMEKPHTTSLHEKSMSGMSAAFRMMSPTYITGSHDPTSSSVSMEITVVQGKVPPINNLVASENLNALSRKEKCNEGCSAPKSKSHLNLNSSSSKTKLTMGVGRESVNSVRSSLAVNISPDKIHSREITAQESSCSSPEKSNNSSIDEDEDINTMGISLHASVPMEMTKVQGVMTNTDNLVLIQKMCSPENIGEYTGRTKSSRHTKISHAPEESSSIDNERANQNTVTAVKGLVTPSDSLAASETLNVLSRKEKVKGRSTSRSQTRLNLSRTSSRNQLSMGDDRKSMSTVRSSLAVNTSHDTIPLREITTQESSCSSPEKSNNSSINEDEGINTMGVSLHTSVPMEITKVQRVMANTDNLVLIQKICNPENIEKYTGREKSGRHNKVSHAPEKSLSIDNESDNHNTVTAVQGIVPTSDNLAASETSNLLSRKEKDKGLSASRSRTRLNLSRSSLRNQLSVGVDRQSVSTVRSSLAVNTSHDTIPIREFSTQESSCSSPEKSNNSSTNEDEGINTMGVSLHTSVPMEITKVQRVIANTDNLVLIQKKCSLENIEEYTGRTKSSRHTKISRAPRESLSIDNESDNQNTVTAVQGIIPTSDNLAASETSNLLSRKEKDKGLSASRSRTRLNLSRSNLRNQLSVGVDRQSVSTVRSSLAVNTSLDNLPPRTIMTRGVRSSSLEESDDSSANEDEGMNTTGKFLHVNAFMETTKGRGVQTTNHDLLPNQEMDSPQSVEENTGRIKVSKDHKVSSSPGVSLASILNTDNEQDSINTVRTSLNVNTSVDSRFSLLQRKKVHENRRNENKSSVLVTERGIPDTARSSLRVNTSLDSMHSVATVLLRDIRDFGATDELDVRKDQQKTTAWEPSSNRTRMGLEDTVSVRESMFDSIHEISSMERIHCTNELPIMEQNFPIPDGKRPQSTDRKSKGFDVETDEDGPSYIEPTPYPMSRSQLMKSRLRYNTMTSYSDVQKRLNLPKDGNDLATEGKDASSDESYHTIEDRLNILCPVTPKGITADSRNEQATANSVDKNVLSDNIESSGNGTRESAKKENVLRKGKKRLLPLRDISAIVSFTPTHSELPEPKKAVTKKKHRRAGKNKAKVEGRGKVPAKKQDYGGNLTNGMMMSDCEDDPINSKTNKSKQKKPRKVVSKEIIVKTTDVNMPKELKKCGRILTDNGDDDDVDDDNDDRPISRNSRRSLDDFQSEKKSVKIFRQIKKSKIVIVTTGLSKEDKSLVKTVAKTLGKAKIEQKVTSQTTHVVSAGVRTINLLRAIIRGCWLVSLDWVLKSLECSKWENPENYEMAHFSKAVQENRRDRQLFGTAYIPELFATCGLIYIENGTTPPAPVLKELVKTAGGRITVRQEEARVVIGEEGLKEIWILDSITTGDLQPLEQYLR